MNTTALKTASENGGPAVLGAGMMLLAVALVVPGHFQPEAAAPRPAPTVTVTTAVPATGQTTVPAPSASDAGASPPGTGATPVSAREPRTQQVSAAEHHPGPGAPSGPKPSPTTQQPAASCTGIAAVRVAGRCVLTVGGSR